MRECCRLQVSLRPPLVRTTPLPGIFTQGRTKPSQTPQGSCALQACFPLHSPAPASSEEHSRVQLKTRGFRRLCCVQSASSRDTAAVLSKGTACSGAMLAPAPPPQSPWCLGGERAHCWHSRVPAGFSPCGGLTLAKGPCPLQNLC